MPPSDAPKSAELKTKEVRSLVEMLGPIGIEGTTQELSQDDGRNSSFRKSNF